MLAWLRRLLDRNGDVERIQRAGILRIAAQVQDAAWWFGEDKPTTALLQDLARRLFRDRWIDAHELREAWRRERAAAPCMFRHLAWLNERVWLGGVMLCEESRRLPARSRWRATAFEVPGAAVSRGECDEEKRLRFDVFADSLEEAVAKLAEAVKAAGPHVLDAKPEPRR